MRAMALLPVLALAGCGSPGADPTTSAGSTSDAGTTAAATTGATTDAATTAAPTTTGDDTTAGASSTGPAADGCNGHVELCARRFDEVVFPTTHNSFSATDDGFSSGIANQTHGVAAQLADGVRALMLDVEVSGDVVVLCHGPCFLGQVEHLDVLADIAAFLAANPREVVTIIYQDSAPVDAIAADLAATGLDQRAFTYAGGPFPTLAEMIAADTRLVVTAENGGPPPAWFHHVWDLTWDTPYTYHSQDEFTCAKNRGDTGNPLFLINHWLSNELDLPSEAGAQEVNVFDVLHPRAVKCMQETGDLPNFVAVDYYEHGDLFAVVDALNGV